MSARVVVDVCSVMFGLDGTLSLGDIIFSVTFVNVDVA